MRKAAEDGLMILKGFAVADLRSLVAGAMEPVLKPLVYHDALALAREHRERGEPTYVVSATLQEIVEELARELGFDGAIGSTCEIEDGLYTGRSLRACHGEGKAAALRELAAEQGFDLSASTAYSDSHTDLPFLEAVGNPVAVNPTAGCERSPSTAAGRSSASTSLRSRPVAATRSIRPRWWGSRSSSGRAPPSGRLDGVQPEERLAALGFSEADAATLAAHFLDAESRGKLGHGLSRIDWLETLPDLQPGARRSASAEPGYERWDGNGALGYLTLAAIVDAQLVDPPEHARVVVASNCFPTGMLGWYVRRLAEGGLVAALTATSPARLAHPDGGEPLAGTNPLALAIPSSDGAPLVADVSMGAVTYGDVLRGAASPDELVPFGGEQAHKGFALALGLQLLVDALAGTATARCSSSRGRRPTPFPALRARAAGLRLPGDA